jgi:transcriptional regulator with XRE-family HTH domain
MTIEINVDENIKKYRNKQGLPQENFAKKSGVKYTTLILLKLRAMLLKSRLCLLWQN